LQAEDGIRDRNVTGVQTCALPIFGELDRELAAEQELEEPGLERADLGEQRGDLLEHALVIEPPLDDAALDAIAREAGARLVAQRSEEHTSELQSRFDLVCRLLLEK